MSSNNSIDEEQFLVSKSVMTSYVVSSMVYEYVMAQNIGKNPKGEKFLTQIEELARKTISIFGIPQIENDMKQINEHFMKKIIDAFDNGTLQK